MSDKPMYGEGSNSPLEINPREAATSLVKVLELARELDEVMPIQMLQIYMLIVQRPGRTVRELADLSGLSQPSISRNCAALGPIHRNQRKGHDLITSLDDPSERRRKIFFLTPKGKHLANRILQAMGTSKTEIIPYSAPTAEEYLNGYVSKLP